MTRPTLRSRIIALTGFLDGVRECAAAGRAGRSPSRESLRRIGLDNADGNAG